MTAMLTAVLLVLSGGCAPVASTPARAPAGMSVPPSPERHAPAVPPKPKPAPSPPAPPPAQPAPVPAPPAPPAFSCKLISAEAPRGGRLEVEGEAFGKTPVVRIAGRIARLLERSGTRIAVQIARDSDGGPVTVEADGQHATCGSLTIIGKD